MASQPQNNQTYILHVGPVLLEEIRRHVPGKLMDDIVSSCVGVLPEQTRSQRALFSEAAASPAPVETPTSVASPAPVETPTSVASPAPVETPTSVDDAEAKVCTFPDCTGKKHPGGGCKHAHGVPMPPYEPKKCGFHDSANGKECANASCTYAHGDQAWCPYGKQCHSWLSRKNGGGMTCHKAHSEVRPKWCIHGKDCTNDKCGYAHKEL